MAVLKLLLVIGIAIVGIVASVVALVAALPYVLGLVALLVIARLLFRTPEKKLDASRSGQVRHEDIKP